MMLELAIGDAYGASYEFCDTNLSLNNPVEGYIQNTRHPSLKPGKYTDDTQMSIAIAELLINEDLENISQYDVANYFLKTFHRDRRQGYSRNFQKFLQQTKSPEEFLANIRPDSDKSGAAMRSCPIGYIKNPNDVLKFAKLQASVTHNTDIGIRASQIVALSCNFFLHQSKPFRLLPKFLKEYVLLEGFTLEWNAQYVGSKGNQAVSAALTAIKNIYLDTGCLSDLLYECVSYGGDTDTVATIALGITSCAPDMFENDLPDVLVYGLECGGKYDKDFLNNLDLNLINIHAPTRGFL